MTTLIVESAARSFVLAAAVALVLALLRVREPEARRAAWRLVLCASLAMPLLMAIAPPLVVPAAPPLAIEPVVRVWSAPATPPVGPPTTPRREIPWMALASAGYALVAGLLLVRFSAGYALTALRLRGLPAAGGRTPIIESAICRTPFTFGFFRPRVVLPPEWREWPDEQRHIVLAHEVQHVDGRDSTFQVLAILHRCVFWFSPLSWWIERRLLVLGEEASDNAVLAARHDRIAYAEMLLRFLERGPGRLAPVVSMVHGGSAERRIARILDAGRAMPRKWSVAARLGLLLALAPVVWFFASCTAMGQPQAATPPPAGAPPQAERPKKEDPAPILRRLFGNPRNSENGWVIVHGPSVTMSGTTGDADAARALRDKIKSDYLWFRRGGNSYVVRDQETVRRARESFQTRDALTMEHTALGQRQAELSLLQNELAAPRTPDVEKELRKIENEVRKLREGTRTTQGDIGRLRASLSQLLTELTFMQSRADLEQTRLHERQSELGLLQTELSARQMLLERAEATEAAHADRAMRELIDKALALGLAEKVQ